MYHHLKTWPGPFQAVWDGAKRHEIRKDDRGFLVGDVLLLQEWDPDRGEYTGREILCDVTYKTGGGEWGIPEGLCVLSVAPYMARDVESGETRAFESISREGL